MTLQSIASLLAQLQASLAAQDRVTINELVASLISARAALGNRWQSLTEVMLHNGEFGLARKAIALHTEQCLYAPTALFQEAAVLSRCGDLPAARRILVALPINSIDVADQTYTLGMVELNIGNVDEARRLLSKAAQSRPTSGAIWLALAMSTKAGSAEALALSILAVEKDFANAAPLDRIQFDYARGRVLHELGEHAGAFSAVQAAGERLRCIRPYSRAEDEASAQAATRGWTRDIVRSVGASVSCQSDRGIIVTGTPRSGTTLVEHILASHSEVADGDEVGSFVLVGRDIGGFSASAAQTKASADANAVPAFYSHVLRERFGTSGRVVDKTVEASRYLGTLAAFVPEAPIVWLRRNALDRAWSCYRTYFAHGSSWSSSLLDIAHHFRLEEALQSFWQDVLGDRLMVVDYERMVESPHEVIPSLLSHCGLSFESAVLNPERSSRAVTTASTVQVREPINKSAIGLPHSYKDRLQSFVCAYGYDE